MAAWIAQADLEARLTAKKVSEYIEDEKGVPNLLALDAAIADAEAEVRASLCAYTLPETATPWLVSLLCRVTETRLAARRRGSFTQLDANLSKEIADELKDYRTGERTAPLPPLGVALCGTPSTTITEGF